MTKESGMASGALARETGKASSFRLTAPSARELFRRVPSRNTDSKNPHFGQVTRKNSAVFPETHCGTPSFFRAPFFLEPSSFPVFRLFLSGRSGFFAKSAFRCGFRCFVGGTLGGGDAFFAVQREEMHILHAAADLFFDGFADFRVALEEHPRAFASLADAFAVIGEP